MVLLAVLTVGAVQLFGARIGYLCGCTGEFSQEVACQPATCHSSDAHQELSRRTSLDENSPPLCDGKHQHSEVRDTPPMTTMLAGHSLPVPVFFELPEAFQACSYEAIEDNRSERLAWLQPTDDRSPPAALLVACTVVLMV
jgi:hypothetical protein